MIDNDFERIKSQANLRDYAETHLERQGASFVCPACGSGTGKNRTTAFSIAPGGKRWKCFSCNRSGDVFDLAGVIIGSEDRHKQLEEVARFIGAEVSDRAPAARERQAGAKPRKIVEDHSEGIRKHTEYVERARQAMGGSAGEAYMTARGFTPLEVERFGLGYDPDLKRVVIPFSADPGEHYHVDRDITGKAAHKYEKPKTSEVGAQPLFNPGALEGEALFIVEGALDALAVEACGYEAVALCSTSNHATVSRIVADFEGVAVVLTDSDKAGRAAAESLAAELAAGGVPTFNATAEWLWGEEGEDAIKDPAELFASDREALADFLAVALENAWVQKASEEEARYSAAMATMKAVDPADEARKIFALEGFCDPVPTGLASLDRALGGGLPSGGLTVLGAVSSLGKTTLAVQIADEIAASGRQVLFVTIEQSAGEIVAKSLSRLMREEGGIPGGVVPVREIMSRTSRESWGEAKTEALARACARYTSEVAPQMRILESIDQPGVAHIKAVAESMCEHSGQAPVVFVDYLQLLAPQNERDTDKQCTDKNVKSLRQLARDLASPVFAISSLNRGSYSGAISMESFKESGAIEYGADVLLGLQPLGIEEKVEEATPARQQQTAKRILSETKGSAERDCEIKVLKQRNGATPREGIPLTFLPVSSLFVDPLTIL